MFVDIDCIFFFEQSSLNWRAFWDDENWANINYKKKDNLS